MEELLQKLDKFFKASDSLPSGAYHWEDDEKKVKNYLEKFNELREHYLLIKERPDTNTTL